MTQEKSKKKSSKSNRLKAYVQYSNLALQMVVIVVLLALGGRWLDKTVENQTPWFTLLGTIVGIGAALYYLYKRVISGMKEQ